MVLRMRASRARAPLLPWVPETFLARLPCNAKRRQQEGWQKINTSNQQKQKDFAAWSTLFCTFLCHCFTRLQRDTSSYMFYGGNVLCVNACVFFSLPLILLLLPQAQVQAVDCNHCVERLMFSFIFCK